MMRILLGLFLIAHALIHAGYLSPAPPRTAGGPEWPFDMGRSWVVTSAGVPSDLVRTIGAILVVATVILFVGSGLATMEFVVPRDWWPSLVTSGAIASVLLLVIFLHPWLVLGLLIDAALLYAVLVAGWDPAGASPGG